MYYILYLASKSQPMLVQQISDPELAHRSFENGRIEPGLVQSMPGAQLFYNHALKQCHSTTPRATIGQLPLQPPQSPPLPLSHPPNANPNAPYERKHANKPRPLPPPQLGRALLRSLRHNKRLLMRRPRE